MIQDVNCWFLGITVAWLTYSGCTGLDIEPCSGQEPVTNVELICRKKNVLSEILVTSQMFDRNCTGEDPDLIARRNQCYWNNSCAMPFPVRKMVTCHKAEDEDPFSSCPCFFQEAKRLLIEKAKCVPEDNVLTMCEGSEIIKGKSGLIRSHDIYPWNLGMNHVNRTCKKSKELNKLKKKTLAVGIRTKELGESESLVLNTAQEIQKFESGVIDVTLKFKNKDENLNITFIGGGDSENFGGFVICFKELKKKQLENLEKSSKHVCDLVAKKDANVKVRVGKYDKKCPQKKKSGSKRKRHADQCCCDDRQCDDIVDKNS